MEPQTFEPLLLSMFTKSCVHKKAHDMPHLSRAVRVIVRSDLKTKSSSILTLGALYPQVTRRSLTTDPSHGAGPESIGTRFNEVISQRPC